MTFFERFRDKRSFDYKQCLVIRTDLKLSKGKTAVQASHASILAYERAPKSLRKKWMQEGQKKVALAVPGVKELYLLKEQADKLGVASALVVDAGLTEIPPGTVTALGLGPDKQEILDKITGKLKLL